MLKNNIMLYSKIDLKRFFKDEIILIQTDTTVGFLSKNSEKLAKIKNRDPRKKFIQVVPSFRVLKDLIRVPNKFKSMVRQSSKKTFIYESFQRNGEKNQNFGIRVVQDKKHDDFLKKFGAFYSSSANLSGENFSYDFTFSSADVICEDYRGLFETKSSKIIKIKRDKKRQLR